MTTKTKLISFVSFKGGSGRTVAMTNVAFQLAHKYTVGCVDLDIEAGSLHKVFDVDSLDKLSVQNFFMKNVDNYNRLGFTPDFKKKEEFIKRLVIDVKKIKVGDYKDSKEFNGSIYLIKAEPNATLNSFMNTSEGYFRGFDDLTGLFSEFLNLDYLLIDCRSGISNLALPGMAYNDTTVVFMRWTKQHRYGTGTFIEWYTEWLDKYQEKQKIFLVVTGVREANLKSVPGYYKELTSQHIKDRAIAPGYLIIPEVKELYETETIFWKEKQIKEQGYYSTLAKIVA
jgi:MinD-like ATPase involved in chromosome partitioning or flagellar assembly